MSSNPRILHRTRLGAVLATAAFSLSLTGCAAELVNVTSGEIGCPREEITVRDGRSGWSSRSWTAECRGETYYCSGSAGNVDCEPATTAPATAAQASESTSGAESSDSAEAGCRYDTQCKGDRVCSQGACVEARTTNKPRQGVATTWH